MVGRLVKQQDLWLAKYYLGDGDSHAPTSRKGAGWPMQIALRKADTRQNLNRFSLLLCSANSLKASINFSKARRLFFFLLIRHFTNIDACDTLQLFKELRALHITV